MILIQLLDLPLQLAGLSDKIGAGDLHHIESLITGVNESATESNALGGF